MNLLGMKRRLLPYGMPLGGAMGALGSIGGGGQASPTNSTAPSGGKSSGLGGLGYGAAPSFGGQQPGGLPISGTGGELLGGQQTAQTQPSFAQSPYGAPDMSVMGGGYDSQMRPVDGSGNLTNQRGGGQGFGQAMQNLGMLGGGKSSGLGQGGYGGAPGFGGQPLTGGPGAPPPQQQSTFDPLDMTQDAQRQRQMQGGMGGMGGMGGFQQPRQQFQQPQQNMQGIQDLFSRMMGQFQQQQRPQQMPQFRSPALGYRPNMSQAQQSLSRVQPSVQKQNQDSQAARIAELEGLLAGFQKPSDGGGG